MSDCYILIDHEPVLEPDHTVWALWFEDADRVVARTELSDDLWVSTVFLGLDHNFGFKGPPILFETMVFKHGESIDQRRYHTWDEAATGHEEIVWLVQQEFTKVTPPGADSA